MMFEKNKKTVFTWGFLCFCLQSFIFILLLFYLSTVDIGINFITGMIFKKNIFNAFHLLYLIPYTCICAFFKRLFTRHEILSNYLSYIYPIVNKSFFITFLFTVFNILITNIFGVINNIGLINSGLDVLMQRILVTRFLLVITVFALISSFTLGLGNYITNFI